MKKKIMLTTIAAIALMAAIPAFKTREKFCIDLCTTTVASGLTCTDEGVFCDFLDEGVETINPVVNLRIVCYAYPDENGECTGNHPCEEETLVIGDAVQVN